MKDDGYRTLTREQKLRNRILDQYASLRQFALAADIPYSSVLTLLSRGIGPPDLPGTGNRSAGSG